MNGKAERVGRISYSIVRNLVINIGCRDQLGVIGTIMMMRKPLPRSSDTTGHFFKAVQLLHRDQGACISDTQFSILPMPPMDRQSRQSM